MPEIKLLAVGDISLKTVENFSPFKNVSSILNSGDILFGNLETVLSESACSAQKAVSIATAPWKVKYLREAGFDVLNLANNHILDSGSNGFLETLEILKEGKFRTIGVSSKANRQCSTIINKNGIAVGFLGYDQNGHANTDSGTVVNRISQKVIIDDIKSLSTDCDIIIVSLHWGIENVSYPSPKQITLARALIDAGADIILGHHPHVFQGIEYYNGGLIAYSLGNFQFEYDVSGHSSKSHCQTDYSMILSIRIGKEGLISYEIMPIVIGSSYLPRLADDPTQNYIFNQIDLISQPLSSANNDWGWWYDQISKRYLSDSLRSWKARIRNYGIPHYVKFCKWLITPFVLRCMMSVFKANFHLVSKTQLSPYKEPRSHLASNRENTRRIDGYHKSDKKVTVGI
jgi:hypothetical protein